MHNRTSYGDIEAFLNNRSHFVFIKNCSSDSLQLISGGLQGCNVVPLLFIIYNNNLPVHVTCNVRMLADDYAIYKTITNTSCQNSLQENINRLQQLCDHWLIHATKINAELWHSPANIAICLTNTQSVTYR